MDRIQSIICYITESVYFMNGFICFLLNICSFSSSIAVRSQTLTVCAERTLDILGDKLLNLLFLVEEHLARSILETINLAGEFDTTSGKGIAVQLDVEDAVGVAHWAAGARHSG